MFMQHIDNQTLNSDENKKLIMNLKEIIDKIKEQNNKLNQQILEMPKKLTQKEIKSILIAAGITLKPKDIEDLKLIQTSEVELETKQRLVNEYNLKGAATILCLKNTIKITELIEALHNNKLPYKLIVEVVEHLNTVECSVNEAINNLINQKEPEETKQTSKTTQKKLSAHEKKPKKRNKNLTLIHKLKPTIKKYLNLRNQRKINLSLLFSLK